MDVGGCWVGRGWGGGGGDGRLVVRASGNTGRLYLDPPHVPALSCVGLSSRANWPGSETVKWTSLTDDVSSWTKGRRGRRWQGRVGVTFGWVFVSKTRKVCRVDSCLELGSPWNSLCDSTGPKVWELLHTSPPGNDDELISFLKMFGGGDNINVVGRFAWGGGLSLWAGTHLWVLFPYGASAQEVHHEKKERRSSSHACFSSRQQAMETSSDENNSITVLECFFSFLFSLSIFWSQFGGCRLVLGATQRLGPPSTHWSFCFVGDFCEKAWRTSVKCCNFLEN